MASHAPSSEWAELVEANRQLKVERSAGGVEYKRCAICKRKRLWPNDFFRRKAGEEARSTRCKFCAAKGARLSREKRLAKQGKVMGRGPGRLTELEKLMRRAKIHKL